MNIQNRLKRSFKFRFAILYPLAAAAVFFAIPDDSSIRRGIGFIIAGLLIRIWANGYAIKLEKLSTSGPYAFVRHPLYLGTALLIIGFNVILRINYLIALALIALIASIYYITIRKEEEMLAGKFKEAYSAYRKKVPAIVPTIFPYRKGEKWFFSFKRLMRSQEYKLFIWIIILIIIFHLKHEFMIERETMDTKIWQLIMVIFVLGLFDLLGELIKYKRRVNKGKHAA